MTESDPPSEEAAALALLLEHRDRAAVRVLCEVHGGPVAALDSQLAGLPRRARRQWRSGGARRWVPDTRSRTQVSVISFCDSSFPAQLTRIPDAPLLLYYRGELTTVQAPTVAMVGARRASRYGLELARSLAQALSDAGVTVVSGLALGVDGAAHRGALHGGSPTAAVLGSGVDRVQPVSHLALSRDILSNGGVLLSEYPPGTPAAPFRFPERNRLISGLCAGVLVIEASARSGSLITARLAGEQGREVMAVPGTPGLPNSTGVNGLLKAGAALVESVEDVLDALALHRPQPGFGSPAQAGLSRLSPAQARLLDFMDGQPVSVDALAAVAGLAAPDCAVKLTELELSGFVRREADGYIRRPSGF
jgi:DNA processing protein